MNYDELLNNYYDKIIKYARKDGYKEEEINPFVKIYNNSHGVFGYEILSRPFEYNGDYLIAHFSTVSEFEHLLKMFFDENL